MYYRKTMALRLVLIPFLTFFTFGSYAQAVKEIYFRVTLSCKESLTYHAILTLPASYS